MTDKEKLKEIKKLADSMYYAAMYLTTDASRLHKAMDEYHKFIVHECKEEPVSEKWIEELRTKLDSLSKKDFKKVFYKYAVDFNEEPVSDDLEEVAHQYYKPNDTFMDGFKKGVNWQKEKMMSKAVNAIPCSILGKEIIYTDLPKEIEIGDEVKVIIIKEE